MKSFIMVLWVEIKNFFSRITIYSFIFFLVMSLYFVIIGIDNYKSIIDQKESFQTIEEIKINQYINYNQYSTYGFRVLFIPSPLSIFFVNSSTITELTSNIDAGERLNIYNSFKGKSLFSERAGGFKDFSGIMLLLGSLLVLYVGYESMLHRDYFLFMTGFVNCKYFYFASILSRLVVLLILFLINGLLALLLIHLNGIQLSNHEYNQFFLYLAGMQLMLVFFFMLGTIAGSIKSRFVGLLMVLISWFILVFLVPGVVGAITASNAENITSNYRLELEKLKRLMGFEKRAIDEVGITTEKNINEVRKLIESYWNNEFESIQTLEEKMEKDMQQNIRLYERLSLVFPSSFYLAVSNEISSKGYQNFILFYHHMKELKRAFARYCIDNRYFAAPSYEKKNGVMHVKPFVKGNENLFYARSSRPFYIWIGFFITLIYIIVLTVFSFYRFKASLKL